jgi:thiol-disulfide isomerase/thioredoxin
LAQNSEASDQSQTKPQIAFLKLPDVARLREEAKGRVLVINFWATWCHGCVAEFHEFVALDDQYREKGVKIVGISFDAASDIDSIVAPFIRKSLARFDIRVPDMEDPQPIIDALTPEWTGAMPVTLMFDQSGKLAYRHFGVNRSRRGCCRTETLAEELKSRFFVTIRFQNRRRIERIRP